VLAHHPLLLHRSGAHAGDGGRRARAARGRPGVAVAAAHTNLDARTTGRGPPTRSSPSSASGRRPAVPAGRPGARAMGRVGDLAGAMTLRTSPARRARGCRRRSTRLCGDADRAVRRVAVLGGAGMSAVPDALAPVRTCSSPATSGITRARRAGARARAHRRGPPCDRGRRDADLRAIVAAAERRGAVAPVVLSDVSTTPGSRMSDAHRRGPRPAARPAGCRRRDPSARAPARRARRAAAAR
jgi:hypothetical protein